MIPGDVIGGRFVIERHVARGGMGDVYRAVDRDTGMPVAVKLILTPDPQHHARLAREARALAELRDPAIVRYIAHDAREGEAFIATEWIEGPSLSERLRTRPLTIEQSLRLARRIARALGTAHRRGMIHRDVKPSNILLPDDDTDRAKLADFGIVRTADRDRLTATGAGIGTPDYMAPEQVRGARELTPAVDVFALGCVLFKCLTGQSAFHAPTVDAVLARIVMSHAPRVRDLRDDVPAPVDELVGAMLASFPEVRPRDGSDVADRLDRVLEQVRATSAATDARRPDPSLASTAVEQEDLRHLRARCRRDDLEGMSRKKGAHLRPIAHERYVFVVVRRSRKLQALVPQLELAFELGHIGFDEIEGTRRAVRVRGKRAAGFARSELEHPPAVVAASP